MINKMVNDTIEFLVSKEIINENIELYEYGFTLIYYELLNFVIILFISACVNSLFYGFVYLTTFTLFRVFLGGYHASTHLKCLFSTIGLYLLYLFLLDYTVLLNSSLFTICIVLAVIIIWCITPVDTSKHRISKKVKEKYEIASKIICSILISLVTFNNSYMNKVFYTVEIVAIYMGILCSIQFAINRKSMREGKNE